MILEKSRSDALTQIISKTTALFGLNLTQNTFWLLALFGILQAMPAKRFKHAILILILSIDLDLQLKLGYRNVDLFRSRFSKNKH